VAEGFVIDTGQARQMSEQLAGVARTIEGFPPGPQASGQLGSGAIEKAVSDFESKFATARQNLTKSVSTSRGGFAAAASNTTNIDQQTAQEASTLK